MEWHKNVDTIANPNKFHVIILRKDATYITHKLRIYKSKILNLKNLWNY